MNNLSIGIIGGGIGGLTAGAALAQAGHKVSVYEQAQSLEAVGAGLQVSPNGMTVLNALGLAERARQTGVRAEAVRLIDGYTGRLVAELNLKRDQPDLEWLLFHRAELIDLLHQDAVGAGAQIHLGLGAQTPEDGEPLDGDDLLIGADGIHSNTRKKVVGENAPSFTGQVAWRAIIDDRSADPIVEVHMGSGRHLVSYPLAQGRRNIVAVEERTDWVEEGWNHPDEVSNLINAFASYHQRVGNWLEQVEQPYLWGLFLHPIPDKWHRGRQVLLGDAAHPTLPFLAQGANLAMEDAIVLRNALSAAPIDQAIQHYTEIRNPRVRRVVDAASANARNYHLTGPKRIVAHNLLRIMHKLAPSQITGRFDWLYRHDVTQD